MAMPANVTTLVVLGTFLTPEGNPSTGTITFTPSRWLTNSGADVAIPNSSITKTLGTAGDFSVTLPVTDDSDLQPANWYYTVSEVIDGVSQSYAILLPGTAGTGGTVYLADIAPAAELGPEYASLRGPAGEAATITVGTVTSGAAGGTPTVTNSGTDSAAVLDFVLIPGDTGPQGETGATGAQGPQGDAATIEVGTVGTVAYGGTPTVTNSGTSGSAVFDFVLVTGPTGGTAPLEDSTPQALGVASAGTANSSARGDHVHSSTIANPTFTGVATFPAGTATAPSITTTGDTNTGVHFPAADTVAIATGGSERVRVNDTGLVIGGTTARSGLTVGATNNPGTLTLENSRTAGQSGNELGVVAFYTNDTSNQGTPAKISGVLEGTAGQAAITVSTGTQSTLAERLRISNSGTVIIGNGSTSASPVAEVTVRGTSGSGTDITGTALTLRGGAGTGAGEGGVVGIYTSAAGASGATLRSHVERFRVDGNGLITGTGTSLGAWTAYTPTLSGTGWAVGDGTLTGAYCQIGKVVIFRALFTAGATSTFGASADPLISLPVTALSGTGGAYTFSAQLFDASLSQRYLAYPFFASTSTVQISHQGTAGLRTTTTATAPFTWTTSDLIIFSGIYQAA